MFSYVCNREFSKYSKLCDSKLALSVSFVLRRKSSAAQQVVFRCGYAALPQNRN